MKDLEDMGMRELLEQGIKSEINAQNVYRNLSKANWSYALSEKLTFLRKQEERHEKKLREIFKEHFPDEEPDIAKEAKKPAPEIDIESDSRIKLLEQAMESEKESEEFYNHLAERLEDEDLIDMAKYMAQMESDHYKNLEQGVENMKKYGPVRGELRAG